MVENKRGKKKTLVLTKSDDELKQRLLAGYELMYLSRLLDEKMLILLKQGKSFFHIGAMGHEALQVACGMAMKPGVDYLCPYYRDQALCLALGQTAYECLLSFLARADDPHGAGRQMPMHYGNKNLNIPTSSSSTGTQFLQALGSAFASMRLFESGESKLMGVTVCTTGEGTTSQGEFYEAVSWAARTKAPLIFLVENNGYAISVPVSEQRPGGKVADNFVNFIGLSVEQIDGCDFNQSFKSISIALDRARLGNGPTLIDASVVRLLPHSSSDDHKKYRSEQDLAHDRERDPVGLVREQLLVDDIITHTKLVELEAKIKEELEEASDKALLAPMPARAEATKHVWAESREPEEKAPVISADSQPVVLVDAVNRALAESLAGNDKVLVFGQDVARGKGGVFTATRGLSERFGDERCFNAPLAEASIVGVAIGMAMRGFKPVAEIQFADYIWTAMMQIRNELATIRYRSNNSFSSPVVIRVPVGGYIHGGLCHSQNIEATFAHIPGIKIALPSTALDAYGLLKRAINQDDPVLFLEHKALYRQSFARSYLPQNSDYQIPFGVGSVRRSGADLTVITYGILVQRALEAAELVYEHDKISVEVIDLRTIVPYDRELVLNSVRKTGKALVLHEDMRFMGFGAEIASDIAENCFMDLDAPVKRLAAKDSPVPYNWDLEEEILPQAADIMAAIRELALF
jgi:2-oxoisovalerate dehydrogenase E1 component